MTSNECIQTTHLQPWQKELWKKLNKRMVDKQFKGRGTIQLTGRQTGKSHLASLLQQWVTNMRPHPVKISWRELPGNKLQAYIDPEATTQIWGLREEDMDPIQDWCTECNCGKRMSFDMWQFKSRKHMTMFLMKWAS